MVRFILKRSRSDGTSAQIESFETLDADVPALEAAIRRGGYGSGHDITHLIGVELDPVSTQEEKS